VPVTQQPEHAGDVRPADPGSRSGQRPAAGERFPVARQRRGATQAEQHERGADVAVAAPTSFERVPPQDLEAEQSVLGGMLLSKDAIADVVEVLKGHDFYRPAHETVYQAILDLYAKGEPADPITVTAELTRRGEISRVGGPGYVHSLVQMVPTAANAEYYADIVHERAVLRRLVEAGTRITQMGYAADGDVDDIVNSAQAEVYAVTEARTSEDYLPLGDIMEGALDEIEAIGSRSGQMTGVPTGFTDLDSLTNGLHPGQMVVIAARPAMGKCIAAMTALVEACTGERITVEDFVRRGQAGEPLEVHTLADDWKLHTVQPADFIHNGRRSVLRLTTQLGRTISATPQHPFRTMRGWVPLEELRPGDRIAVVRDLPAARPSGELPGGRLSGELPGGRLSGELPGGRLSGEVPGEPAALTGHVEERVGRANPDLIPGDVWELIKTEKGDRSWAEISARTGRPPHHDWHVGQQLSRHRLLDLAKALDSQKLIDIAESDVLWDSVASVVPDGEAEVYDLTVDGTHNFVADGIVVHNSTLALDFARTCSVKHSMPSVIFSLEMGRNEIAMRLLSAEARVALHHMRSGSMTDEDWTRLARQMPGVTDAPLYIDDSPNLSMMEIRAKCRRLKQRNDLKLVVIDYLQLMQTGSSRRPESRQQEVSEMSRNLKLLAKELEVPVVALSQLNRGPEQRTDKKPMVSDLRESGCMTADTTLLRADTGAPVTFAELMEHGHEGVLVWSLDEERRLVPAPVTNVFSSGTKPVYRLRLASGREVKATANHPFLTFEGWRPLGDLEVGSRVAVPRRTPEPIAPALDWTEHRLGLLAHLIGDGCVLRKQPIHYTSNDEANLAFVEAAAAEFGITPRRVKQEAWWHTYLPAPFPCTHGRHNPLHVWFRELGIENLRSHQKRIPDVLYAADDKEVAIFLRHLWATDGSVWVPKQGRKSAPKAYYSTSSRTLADGVAALLSRFGITARIRKVTKKGYRSGYHVTIADGPGLRIFCQRIGVHGRRGEKVTQLLAYVNERATNTNADSLPSQAWDLVKAERVRAGLTERQFQAAIGTRYCGSTLYKSGASRERMIRVADALRSEKLRDIADDDVFWDRVVEIEALGPQPVYDATVKGTHNFIADGIAAHNSIEQDADMVVLLHREDAYEKESPRAGEADLIVAKHRNGPTATITVAFQGHYSRFVDMAQT
jgi:replicative DNA helicase